ncbi:MAG: hypothetical protein GF329_06760, partial [Candidatus Lokiarchaeota archaeon]|nr:hypothetical protein [Candidatus Lokiarchaeota archaeon]
MRLLKIKKSKLFILFVIFSLSLLFIGNQFQNITLIEKERSEGPIENVIKPSDIKNKLNTTICNAINDQRLPQIIGDGSGGAIIVWEDMRLSNKIDIYAQRINATGHPLWNPDGVFISNRTGNSTNPVVTSDGEGGAIVAWQDDQVGNWEIYCQRINSTGQSPWNTHFNRTRITTNGNNDTNPSIIGDGSGGAFISWQTNIVNPFPIDLQIYAGHVTSTGSVDWTQRIICQASDDQKDPRIIYNGVDGAIITWEDFRSGSDNDIYAQKINSTGAVQWTANGVVISNASREQINPEITQDGNSGAIITWQDFSSGSDYDIYAQRVNSSGHYQWQNNGNLICGVSNQQTNPIIISDNLGGAIISWEDRRDAASTSTDIYSQRINSEGQKLWASVGIPVCNALSTQEKISMASDGLNGAFITWQDYRSGSDYNIYAQHSGPTGLSHWENNGTVICNAIASQISPQVTKNGTFGAVITWQDYRNGNYDIYSQIIYTIDNTPPSAPDIFSTTHPDSDFAYSSNDVEIQWTKPLDASDITNYFYIWDKNSTTIPESFDHITDIQNVNLSGLSDGTWYFHVRANDTMGNFGETGHFNFTIDTTCNIKLENFTLEASTNQQYSLVLEDFDGDSDLDLASSDNTSSVYIWWNPFNETTGINSFEDINNWTKTLIGTTTGNVLKLEASDLNHDGKKDLIGLFNSGSNGRIIIWENNETPMVENWSSKIIYSTFSDTITYLDVADYNYDGDLDLFFSTGINHQIFSLSNPYSEGYDPFNSTWTNNTIGVGSKISELKVSDINRNGFLDVIYADERSISMIKQNSSGWTDLGEIFNASANITTLEITDLDYNGKLDVIMGLDNGEILFYAHNGDPFSSDWNKTFVGNINETGAVPNALGIADLGKNGYKDIIVAFKLISQKTVIQIFRNNRRPLFDDWATIEQGTYESICYGIASGDIDHDDGIDLAFGTINIYLVENNRIPFNPTLTSDMFSHSRIFSASDYIYRIRMVDLDHDGDYDAVGTRDASRRVFAWRNNGDPFGTWSSIVIYELNYTNWGIDVGDFDNDGWADVIVGSYYGLYIFKNNHSPWIANWEWHKVKGASSAYGDVNSVDLNNDGLLYIVAAYGMSVKVLYNNGTPFRDNWDEYTIGTGSGSCVVGEGDLKIADFDKDGWIDIVSSHYGGRIYVWRNNHTPFYDSWSDYTYTDVGSNGWRLAINDLDKDGDPDIITSKFMEIFPTTHPSIKVLECDDTPFNSAWTSMTIYSHGSDWCSDSIGAGDLDSDGWTDIFDMSSTSSGTTHPKPYIFLNDKSPFNDSWNSLLLGYDSLQNTYSSDTVILDIDFDGDRDIIVTTDAGGGGQYGAHVWENLAEIDKTGPSSPVISSFTHPNQNSWYNLLNVSMQWDAYDPSGINNYLYCVDQNSLTEPSSTNASTTQSNVNISIPSEGIWYFHVRGNDTQGNLGSAGHYKLRIDKSEPFLFNIIPKPESYNASSTPEIQIIVNDTHSGVNLTTLTMNVEGIDYNITSPQINTSGENPSKITFIPPSPYSNEQIIDVLVNFSDNAQNWISTYSWNFTIDTESPVAFNHTPNNNSYTSDTTPDISVIMSDNLSGLNISSVEMEINGSLVNPSLIPLISDPGAIKLVSTESSDYSKSPAIAIDDFGNIHVVWHDSGTYDNIFYRLWNTTTSSWSSTEELTSDIIEDANYARIAVDSEGNVHVVFCYGPDPDLDNISYKYRNKTTGIWSGFINSTDLISTSSSSCDIALDQIGQPHIVWRQDNNISYTSWNETLGEWKDAEIVSTESTSISMDPSISLDSMGTPHIIWVDSTNIGESDNGYDIFYKYKNISSGIWATVEVVSPGSSAMAHQPDITTDELGNVYVVWRDVRDDIDGYIYYRQRNATSLTWKPMEIVCSFSGYSSNPMIDEKDGSIHIAWRDGTNYLGAGSDYDIFYRVLDSTSGKWSNIGLISEESGNSCTDLDIVVDNNKIAHIVWRDPTDILGASWDDDIFYKNISISNLWMVNWILSPSISTSTPILVEVNAADLVGNAMNTYIWNFTVDLDPPMASNPFPLNESSIIDTDPIIYLDLIDTLSGLDNSTITLTVNGSVETHSWNGTTLSWDSDGPYPSGTLLNLAVDVQDNLGNIMETYTWWFEIDLDPPNVSNYSPTNQSYTNDSTPTIQAYLFDSSSGVNESSIILMVNDQEVSYNYVDNTVSWTNSTVSPTGYLFNVKLDASDNLGNQMDTFFWSFTIDSEAPVASNPIPNNETYTDDDTPTISVDLMDLLSGVNESTIILTINNQKVSHNYVDNTVSWTNSTISSSGYIINVELNASDNVGNVMGTYSWSFTIDTEAPIASNPEPADITYTADNTPTISVDLTDALSGVNESTITLIVNGQEVPHTYLGDTVSWTNSTVSLNGYVFNVELNASDNVGNVMGTYSWSFTIDTEAPIASNPEPADGTYTADNTPTISVDLTDALSGVNESTITLIVNGQEVPHT